MRRQAGKEGWRERTSGESCTLDVIQVVSNSVPSSAAPGLVAWVAFGGVGALGKGITIGDDSEGEESV